MQDNLFAFSPGQLNKMFNPKSLLAFWEMGRLVGLEKATARPTGEDNETAEGGLPQIFSPG